MAAAYDVFWGKESFDNHEYRQPGPDDLRSPCPFLNTCANHGHINRSGRYITWWAATKALMDVYNFSLFMALFVASAGWWTGIVVGWNPFWFNLKQLREHTPYLVEHDASLSRRDIPDNNWQPDPKLVEAIIDEASSPAGVGHADLAHHRVQQENKLNYILSKPRAILATGECGLILPTIGRGSSVPEERRMHPSWVTSFFLHERLPEDWTRPDETLTLWTTNHVAGVVRDDMVKIRADAKIQKSR